MKMTCRALLGALFFLNMLSMDTPPVIGDTHDHNAYIFDMYDTQSVHVCSWAIHRDDCDQSVVLKHFRQEYALSVGKPIAIQTDELKASELKTFHPFLKDVLSMSIESQESPRLYEKLSDQSFDTIAAIMHVANYLHVSPLVDACITIFTNTILSACKEDPIVEEESFYTCDQLPQIPFDRLKDLRCTIAHNVFEKSPALTYWLLTDKANAIANRDQADELIEIENSYVTLIGNMLKQTLPPNTPKKTKVLVRKNTYDVLLKKLTIGELYLIEYMYECARCNYPLNLNMRNTALLFDMYENVKCRFPWLIESLLKNVKVVLPNVARRCS